MATVRRLDPIFGGLARVARQGKLPLTVFLGWMVSSTFLAAILYVIFGKIGLIFSLLAVSIIYSVLVMITRKEDKGVGFLIFKIKRWLSVRKNNTGAYSYETADKNIKDLDFEGQKEALSEVTESRHLPFERHVTPNIIKCKNGDLITVIKFEGIPYETQSYDYLESLKNYTNNSLLQFDSRIGIHAHYIRSKVKKSSPTKIKNYFGNLFLNSYSTMINGKRRYSNDIYVTLIMRSDDPSLTAGERLLGAIEKSESKLIKELDSAATSLMKDFESAKPKQLGIINSVHNQRSSKRCEALQFLSYIVNFDKTMMPLVDEPICDYLSYTRKEFHKDHIVFHCVNGINRIASVFGIPTDTYPPGTDHQMVDSFLKVDGELIVSMSYYLMDKNSSTKLAKDKQGFMEATNDDSKSQLVAINKVRDDITSGKLLNGVFNLSVLVHAENMEDFKRANQEVRNAIGQIGFIPKREDTILEPAFYGMLPGNYHLINRSGIINTLNFAGFLTLHNAQLGKQYGNHWKKYTQTPSIGDYVLEFTSDSLSPYYCNFHIADVGHSRFIAQTGTGKTTLLNALLAAALRFDTHIYHFDFLHSAAAFIKAADGVHQTIMPNQRSGWNPFQCPDTEENRAFLFSFVSFLVAERDKDGLYRPTTAREAKEIQAFVNQIFTIDMENRVLRHLSILLGSDTEGSITERLGKWHSDGAFASIFDNEKDTFTLEGSKVFCFEMKHIIDNYDLLPAVVMYIAHRIDQAMTKREPFLIVFEEGQRLIQNQILETWMLNLSTTIRRRNGCIVFVSPTADVFENRKGFSEQFKTSFFFPNSKASYKTYCGDGGLGCTDKEYEFIKNEPRERRRFLIKSDHEAVISSLDLSDMMEFVHIFSGDNEKNDYIDSLIAKHGTTKASAWLPEFNQRYN